MMSSGDRISSQRRNDRLEKLPLVISPMAGEKASPTRVDRTMIAVSAVASAVAGEGAHAFLLATSHARLTVADGLAPNARATPSISRSTSTLR